MRLYLRVVTSLSGSRIDANSAPNWWGVIRPPTSPDAGTLSGETLMPALEGATFVDHPDGNGVRVATLEPRSRAVRNGLRPDDVIVAVNRRPVRDLRQFREQLQNAQRALGLTVQRGSVGLFIVIQ